MDININGTITVQLNAETLEVIKTFFGKSLSAETTGPTSTQIEAVREILETKPAKNGKPKVEKPAPEQSNGQETAELVKLTLAEVRALVQKKSAAGHKEKIKALLSDFGADKLTSLQEKDFAAYYAKVEAL